ncbi:MAG: hypothetical protein GSR78_01145 [Desulfurococcales archaeon]|nr:hypothetical protein [Desulfurococcales archaeon]
MSQVGVGPVTGARGIGQASHAIILDNRQVFNNVKRGMERVIVEYTGLPGFQGLAGVQLDTQLVVQLIPPYPQAVAQAVSELYALGVRNVILVGRGFRLRRNIEQGSVAAIAAAIPLDSTTRHLVPEGLPLLPDPWVYNAAREVIEVRFSDLNLYRGYSVSVDHPLLSWIRDSLEGYAGVSDIVSVDPYSGPLYGLRYRYPRLRPLALLSLHRVIPPSLSPLESSVEVLSRTEEAESKTLALLYMAGVEILRHMEESRVG